MFLEAISLFQAKFERMLRTEKADSARKALLAEEALDAKKNNRQITEKPKEKKKKKDRRKHKVFMLDFILFFFWWQLLSDKFRG